MVKSSTSTASLHELVRGQLPDGSVIVREVDHPYLILTPDMLVGNSGDLVAIFFIRASEARDKSNLLARLSACRLGLPNHTRCLLLVEDSLENSLHGSEHHFHEVLSEKDHKSIIHFLKDKNARGRVKEIPTGIRRQTHNAYGVSLSYFKIQEKESKIINEEKTNKQDYLETIEKIKTKIETKNIYKKTKKIRQENYRGFPIHLISPNITSNAMLTIYNLCNKYFKHHFTLDTGIPYPSERMQPQFFVVDQFPLTVTDPFKPIRCAAFSNWCTVDANNLAQLDQFVERFSTAFFKRVK
ncbi:hypothetical protein [Thalassospira lucentensis]|uniref:hypothetical protein n=1 Tax=Thalassospira lucentensis TaxID=168935 RepID=UPI00294352FA|nr:hypothetical protein [Thalassospira lucentensis]WOI10909.1 hypothetical protein R1T41_20705 [Thalassospira lucentensis]